MNLQLLVSKGQPVLSAAPQHIPQYTFKSGPPPSELNHVAQPAIQQSSPASMYVPESGSEPADESYGLEDEGLVYHIMILFVVLLVSIYFYYLYHFCNGVGFCFHSWRSLDCWTFYFLLGVKIIHAGRFFRPKLFWQTLNARGCYVHKHFDP